MGWSPFMCLIFLLFSCQSNPCFSLSSPTSPLCHPDESIALLQFKNSFSILNSSYMYASGFFLSCYLSGSTDYWYHKTNSWENGTNCCTWSGVTCDKLTGHVISLDVGCSGLQGILHSNNSLFSLTHLQTLVLSDNDFDGSPISSQFGKFAHLTHLDLSSSRFSGHVPLEIAHLSKLITLSLRDTNVEFDTPTLKRVVQNLTHLRGFYLSYINMSSVSPASFTNLSTSLTYLLLTDTSLQGKLPENIFRLPNLQVLFLWGNHNLSGSFPKSNWSSPLRELYLSGTGFSIDLAYLTRNLKNLNSLSLVDCKFIGSNPTLLDNFTQITDLDLSYNNFSGQVPLSSLNFKKFISLDLSGNNFVGELPKYDGNLNEISSSEDSSQSHSVQYAPLHLEYLSLSDNKFNGTLPSWLYVIPSLQYLFLHGNQFTGFINEFKTLSLKSLDLHDNQLEGMIPRSFSQLSNLTWLDLSSNNLAGVVEFDQFAKLKNLNSLDLSFNKNLSASSSNSVNYTLPNLSSLSFSSCNLTQFPLFLKALKNLEYLYLSSNNLAGVVEFDQFAKLKNLNELDLSFNKNLSASSSNSVNYTLPNLSRLSFSSCNLTQFPLFLKALKNLTSLDLSNNQIHGKVPKWLRNMGTDSLTYLNLSHNFLTNMEQVPWKNMEYLDLRWNLLQGPLPIPPPSTVIFLISNNQLSGELPSLICQLNQPWLLDLSNNSLNGTIPPCIGYTNASILDLRLNRFHGVIPSTFANGNALTNLNLNGNQLEGSLPKSLINCKMLEILDVGNNKINGTFPHWLESLPMLQVLILRANKFHGPIGYPESKSPFRKLRILDISDNEFTGLLPTKYFENMLAMMESHTDRLQYMGGEYSRYYQDSVVVTLKGFFVELVKIQTIFTTIDFSKNHFKGDIPKLIGKLKSLKGLNFSHNMLTGSIPASLGNLTNLEWLDLSSNQLVGEIPKKLADLTFLQVLNLSHNQLVGAIPSGKQFNTFENDSYSGNTELCGFPLSKGCESDSEQKPTNVNYVLKDELVSEKLFDWKFAFIGYGCGLVFGISMGYVVFSDKMIDRLVRKCVGGKWYNSGKRQKRNAPLNARHGRRRH